MEKFASSLDDGRKDPSIGREERSAYGARIDISGRTGILVNGRVLPDFLSELNSSELMMYLAIASKYRRATKDIDFGSLDSSNHYFVCELKTEQNADLSKGTLLAGTPPLPVIDPLLRASIYSDKVRIFNSYWNGESQSETINDLASSQATADDASATYEKRRAEMLDRASSSQQTNIDPIRKIFDDTRDAATDLLGGAAVLGREIASDDDVVEAVSAGFPVGVIAALRDSRVPAGYLEEVIAPRRTLMRRKSDGRRLTPTESDNAWRLASTVALASRVLDGPKAAYAWLSRPKTAFYGRSPIELLKTSVGTASVQQLLNQLEWGEVA